MYLRAILHHIRSFISLFKIAVFIRDLYARHKTVYITSNYGNLPFSNAKSTFQIIFKQKLFEQRQVEVTKITNLKIPLTEKPIEGQYLPIDCSSYVHLFADRGGGGGGHPVRLGATRFWHKIKKLVTASLVSGVNMSDYWSRGRGFDPRHFHKF